MLPLPLLYLVFLSSLHGSLGAFTVPTCWPGSTLCVQQNSEKRWCYVPKAGETVLTDCKGAQDDLQAVVDVHLNQDLSIAYYNGADNTRYGGADWPIPANPGIVRLCASGKSGDGVLQTICMNIAADNTFSSALYCEVALGPPIVSDGCYLSEVSSTPNIIPSTSQQSHPTTSTASTASSALTSSVNFVATSPSSSIGSGKISSTTTSATPSTTIAVIDNHNTNKITEIVVPLVVAILGLIAALVKFC